MAAVLRRGKLYPSFTLRGAFLATGGECFTATRERFQMVGIAIAMFIALFGWGARYFGWSDPDGKVQLAIATAFILGCISGYKSKSSA